MKEYTIARRWKNDGVAVGISEAAFKCGLRLPLLPILKKLFREMGIALGQMDPNGFTHINGFQCRCLASRVTATTRLFWHHYDFRRNPKSRGFYTIARRPGRADWIQTNSNNKGSHNKWFQISGPKVGEFSVWREVDVSRVVMLKLTEIEEHDYQTLCLTPTERITLQTSRDPDWLLGLWGTGTFFLP